MVLELLAIIVAILVASIISSIISTKTGLNGVPQLVVELIMIGIAGLILIEFSVITLPMLAVAIVGAGIVGVIGLLNTRRQAKKARSGDYGDEVKWATELIDDGDELFIFAINTLSQTEMREIGIIAESKEQMRELTIERFEEKGDDGIPQDFMQ